MLSPLSFCNMGCSDHPMLWLKVVVGGWGIVALRQRNKARSCRGEPCVRPCRGYTRKGRTQSSPLHLLVYLYEISFDILRQEDAFEERGQFLQAADAGAVQGLIVQVVAVEKHSRDAGRPGPQYVVDISVADMHRLVGLDTCPG